MGVFLGLTGIYSRSSHHGTLQRFQQRGERLLSIVIVFVGSVGFILNKQLGSDSSGTWERPWIHLCGLYG